MADNLFDNVKIQFEQFLSLVGNVLSHEKDIHLIQNKLRRHFNTTSSTYLCSTDFQSLLVRIHDSFNGNAQSTKFFKLLHSFDEQLKKNSIKMNVEDTISAQTDDQSCDNVSSPRITTDMELGRKKKICKLEHRLNNLSNIIRELEEKELSLDEMRYSDLYQVESKLKKQAYDLYIRIADLKNQSSSVERILDQPVTLTDVEIDHPLINKALEDMVNRTRFLPCFNDVFNVVEKTDSRYELGLSVDARKNIAEKAFKIIGMKVKDRRIADFTDIMNSRLPEDFDIERNDPALDDTKLEQTLLENGQEATVKIQRIFEKYSQIDPDLQSEVDVGSSDSEEEEEDIDDNQDKAELELDPNVYTSDDYTIGNYDVVDILPPFSPCPPPHSPSNTNETIHSEDPITSPLDDSMLRSLSIASIPAESAIHNQIICTRKPIPAEESQPISLIPRRRQQRSVSTSATDETLNSTYHRQRTTTNDFSAMPKRPAPDIDSSASKKRKEILD